MRALVWIVEDTWEATVDEAADLLPADAEVTLLHVAGSDAEAVAGGARNGLLGRRRPDPGTRSGRSPTRPRRACSRTRAPASAATPRSSPRAAASSARSSPPPQDADLLVLARDGDHDRLGPHSLAPPARFVVDHAPCRVLLVWPDAPPPVETLPPPPH